MGPAYVVGNRGSGRVGGTSRTSCEAAALSPAPRCASPAHTHHNCGAATEMLEHKRREGRGDASRTTDANSHLWVQSAWKPRWSRARKTRAHGRRRVVRSTECGLRNARPASRLKHRSAGEKDPGMERRQELRGMGGCNGGHKMS